MTSEQEKLALGNQRLVYYCLSQMHIPKDSPLYEDLAQKGMFALCKQSIEDERERTN